MDVQGLISDVAERLGLAREARRNATVDTPMSGMVPVIVAAAQEEGRKEAGNLRECRRDAEGQIAALQKALEDAGAKLDNPHYGQAPSRANVDFAQQRFHNAAAEYAAFKKNNGIERDASGDDRLVQMGWAFIIAVIEGALNSRFFAPAFEGLIDAFVIAFFVGFVNVAFAFIGGALGLRYALNHNKPHAKLFGLIFFCLCFSVCVVTVAASSYFRAHVDVLILQEGTDILKLSQTAWELSWADMQQANVAGLFASLNSSLLFFVGALCAIVGLWKGHEFDDPYPGFGRMDRLREEAQEEFEEAQSEYNEQSGDWRRDKSRVLADIKRNLELVHAQARAAVDGLANISMTAGSLLANTKQLAQGLLNFYCGAYRDIAPVPAPVPEDISDEPFGFLSEACRAHENSVPEINRRFEESEKDYLKMLKRIRDEI